MKTVRAPVLLGSIVPDEAVGVFVKAAFLARREPGRRNGASRTKKLAKKVAALMFYS